MDLRIQKNECLRSWNLTMDLMLIDIVRLHHPCNEKPSVMANISLCLSEGIQELKLEQQLAPTREAISWMLRACEWREPGWVSANGHASGKSQCG
jgi:hypothetical protein